MSFLSAKDRISSDFLGSQKSCMSFHLEETVLDSLSNIAVGRLLGYRASIILMRLVEAVFFFKKQLNFFIVLIKQVLVFARWMSYGSCS